MKLLLCPVIFLFTMIIPATVNAQDNPDSLQRLLKKATGRQRIEVLNQLTYYYFQSDAKKAIAFGTESLALARKQKDQSLLSSSLNELSMPYLTEGNFYKVIELNEEALKIRRKLGDSTSMVGSYAKLGSAYFELAQYEKATDNFTRALNLSRTHGNQAQEMQLLVNLANVLDMSGLLKESYQVELSAIKLSDKLQDPASQVTSRLGLATVCRKMGRYEESIRYYKSTIKLLEEYDETESEYMAAVYQGLGVIERERHNHQARLDYYKKAYSIYKKLNSGVGISSIAVNIGNTYAELHQIDSAEIYLNIGLKNSLATKSYKQITNALEALAALEKVRNNYKQAFSYLEMAGLYKDSVQLFQGNTAISEMYAKYETEKKDRELTQSKLKNAEKDKQIAQAQLKISKEKQNRLIWSGIGLFALLAAAFFSRNLYLKRKAAVEEIASTKKNEQLRRERELNEQKIEISRELHDNIGSQLTYMISSMDNLTYTIPESDKLTTSIRDLSDFGRGTMQELRSTIWAMNSEDGSVDLLIRKLEELRSKIPLELVLKNELNGNPPLKAIEMLNLYRIGQEVIQNCLKYANATQLSITAKAASEGGVQLIFADNGNGFDLTDHGNGNGLRNMRHRCEQLDGKFEVRSEKGRGTEISCALRHLSY